MTAFAPVHGVLGGLLIGMAAVLLMGGIGRIAGVCGIVLAGLSGGEGGRGKVPEGGAKRVPRAPLSTALSRLAPLRKPSATGRRSRRREPRDRAAGEPRRGPTPRQRGRRQNLRQVERL